MSSGGSEGQGEGSRLPGMRVRTIWYLWEIGCANEPEIHQGFLMAGWSPSTDQLAHNYFPFLKAYRRGALNVCA